MDQVEGEQKNQRSKVLENPLLLQEYSTHLTEFVGLFKTMFKWPLLFLNQPRILGNDKQVPSQVFLSLSFINCAFWSSCLISLSQVSHHQEIMCSVVKVIDKLIKQTSLSRAQISKDKEIQMEPAMNFQGHRRRNCHSLGSMALLNENGYVGTNCKQKQAQVKWVKFQSQEFSVSHFSLYGQCCKDTLRQAQAISSKSTF